uniref:Putative maturase n=1 Tax=Porphyridium purpureum TaxID=35688 RepID=A0A0A7RU97_PORPP|nr:putative maturase [Porphyridium purpureum]AJA41228.1 putative maturase [Porphyridium purpureum]AJA41231.1 putative maturase [Porphyridium purpureum]AJA41233.1 putative maturase [Porphyridium purpureum]AJA41235.1 putative maturase [Porphyridium purpureum]
MQPTLKSCVEDWKALPWKQFQKQVFRLQHRIYKAQQIGNYKLVHKLQRLLFSSRATRFLAIRQVTQLNTGKVTAGVDGKAKLNEKERFEMFNSLKDLNNYKHSPLRRVFIPKLNGEKRPLGIPTIKDRTIQCIVKYLLEPVYEAYASKGSWGFRPGRSTWDVQSNIQNNLGRRDRNYKKRILELDIEKCFDRINHDKLLSLIHLPIQMQKIIKSALKAGVLNEKISTQEGTPQGGIISPLLCNIVLHGIEDLWNQPERQWDNKYKKYWYKKSVMRQRGLRYADDMIFFLEDHEDANELRKKIDSFLAERGLNVKEAKTHLVKSIEGFDFLGWRFEVKANNALTCWPSRENRRQMISNVRAIMKDARFTLEERLNKVKIIYRGWMKYHQYCDLKKINLWSINDWTYNYVKKLNSKLNRKDRATAKIKRIDAIKDIFNGHNWSLFNYTATKSAKSPFDNDWLYWSKRKHKQYWGPFAKVLTLQKFKCNACNLKFAVDDHVELHHIDGNHKNNKYKNLEALHRSCHHYKPIHGLKRRKATA